MAVAATGAGTQKAAALHPQLPSSRGGVSRSSLQSHVQEECRALRLENEALRCRIRELERANEELLAFAGQDPPPQSAAGPESVAPAVSSSGCRMCSNCGREVPVLNYEAHVIHCERNFHRCAACGDVIPIREKGEHLARWTDTTWALKAAREGDLPVLRSIRAHGARLETMTCQETGETLLHMAAQQGSAEFVSLLLSRGAPQASWLAAATQHGQAALHIAVAEGHESVAALLLESRAEVNQKNAAGDTPLLVACRGGAAPLVRRLAEQRADLEARTALGDSALQVAQAHGHMDCGLALGVRRVESRERGPGEAGAMPPLRQGSRAADHDLAKSICGGSAPPTAGAGRAPPTPLSMR
mmetsp:Transcript_95967/g.280502  ORF Transcript_95967/g.280502 Transcript_95967/m.280502 type:complete len:358 (-) Transcript_95967:103-1176(-)